MSAKVVFAGTPAFALPSLQALISHDRVQVVAVYTQPDKPAGRGRKLTPSPIKVHASERDIPVYQPQAMNSPDVIAQIQSFDPDLMVVTAYGMILPPSVLSIPTKGCINVHGSLLPRWRGAAPVHRAIEAGDSMTGVSLMHMEAGLDTGPVYAQSEVAISSDDTGGILYDRLATAGGSLLHDHLDGLLDGTLEVTPQDPEAVTYASRLSRAESVIAWDRPASEIACRIRAFNPWPAANTTFQGKRLKLLMAQEATENDTQAAPGTVLLADSNGVMIACNPGAVQILQLQKEGGKAMSARDFCNGTDISVGEQFG